MGIYRPPSKSTISQFPDELSYLLEEIRSSVSSLLILGDFNIPISHTEEKTEVDDFIQTMTALGFSQHCNFYTHQMGNILDLEFTECISPITVTRCYPGLFPFDHRWIMCDLSVKQNCVQRKVVKVRNLNTIDSDKFTCLLKKIQIDSSVSITNQAAKLRKTF